MGPRRRTGTRAIVGNKAYTRLFKADLEARRVKEHSAPKSGCYTASQASVMGLAPEKATIYRQALQKVLDSHELSSARQLRDFLEYTGEAAISGRRQIEQVEIARSVLKRGEEFNPVDDSTVRKIGSLLRQRLEKYYATEGVGDPVIISLPVRSYVPLFRERNAAPETAYPEQPEADLEPVPVPAAGRGQNWLWLAVPAAAVLAFAAGYYLNVPRAPAMREPGEYRLVTVRGDFLHDPLDVPAQAIQVGPALGSREDLLVRLNFRPEQTGQQAGLLFFQDADNYVKLARQFISRANLEFGAERNAVYTKPAGTFEFDPWGHNGKPVWLSIRREDSTFQAFRSLDGETWQGIGNKLQSTLPAEGTRAALYANRSRTDSDEIAARFDHFAHGLVFHDMAERPIGESDFPGWKLNSWCGPNAQVRQEKNALVFDINRPSPCGMNLARPLPAGDWTLWTRMDFVPSGGSAAGLVITGEKGTVRFIRWDVNGNSIAVEQQRRTLVHKKDYAGFPPLDLFLECKAGKVRARFTRDGTTFEQLPVEIDVAELGKNLTGGLHATRMSWSQGASGPEARFYWILHEIHRTSNFK